MSRLAVVTLNVFWILPQDGLLEEEYPLCLAIHPVGALRHRLLRLRLLFVGAVGMAGDEDVGDLGREIKAGPRAADTWEGVPAVAAATGAERESEHMRVSSDGNELAQVDHAIPRAQGGNATIENEQSEWPPPW